MMVETMPFATLETRWFLDGTVEQRQLLKRWFETTVPLPKHSGVKSPVWQARRDGQPDIYLLVPGSDDMGIKWREGLLQIKGRVASHGIHQFSERHQGTIERWTRWSYANLPYAYRQLFQTDRETGLITVAVHKTRAQRLVRLDTVSGKPVEVDIETTVERSIALELTALEVAGKAYWSLAFEASPSDAAMDAQFIQTIEAFLNTLTEIRLIAMQSLSYPAWLAGVIDL